MAKLSDLRVGDKEVKVGDIVAFTIGDNSGRGGFGVVTCIKSGVPYPFTVRFIATDWTRDNTGHIAKSEITQIISQVPHEQG